MYENFPENKGSFEDLKFKSHNPALQCYAYLKVWNLLMNENEGDLENPNSFAINVYSLQKLCWLLIITFIFHRLVWIQLYVISKYWVKNSLKKKKTFVVNVDPNDFIKWCLTMSVNTNYKIFPQKNSLYWVIEPFKFNKNIRTWEHTILYYRFWNFGV